MDSRRVDEEEELVWSNSVCFPLLPLSLSLTSSLSPFLCSLFFAFVLLSLIRNDTPTK